MSHFLDTLLFFRRDPEPFAGGHGETRSENRDWEGAYRRRWESSRIVRSTHGVNCTGGCSWKIHVKEGLVAWESQYTDYPRQRPDMPDHEPRGCARGASYSWYLYSAARIKYPLIRSRLLALWRQKRETLEPVEAWAAIVDDEEAARSYKSARGLGGFVRGDWETLNELMAAANIHTIKRHGPDRIAGFSPIPAMSMTSYAAGTRYLSLIGGTVLSFYDWYCDLPPSCPQTWGEQTDVPESADWYQSDFLLIWGSNVPQTRTPDAHFYVEARYRGAKSAVIAPDFNEAAKFADLWLAPTQGSDAALALAMGHVVLKEFFQDQPSPYFQDYCRRYSDLPFLIRLDAHGEGWEPGRLLRACDFADALGEGEHAEWKPVVFDEKGERVVAPPGSIGHRWEKDGGRWNLDLEGDTPLQPALSLMDHRDRDVGVNLPYFADRGSRHVPGTGHGNILARKVPARELALAEGKVLVTTVFDLMMAHYGVERGLEDATCAAGYDDDAPFTPAWQEPLSGVSRSKVIALARAFADNAHRTQGRSMVILGAGLNHWYHGDMAYRGIINLLVLCGCVGKNGGGWAHYVGQEKVRPLTAWSTLSFALDWSRPPRHMNGTSYWYLHTDQWRYEKLDPRSMLAPHAHPDDWPESLAECNAKAIRMGWLPGSPELAANPLAVCRQAAENDQAPEDYVRKALAERRLDLACHHPDDPGNVPRNLFVWRSNLLGSSAKGQEYFLHHLLGALHGINQEEMDSRASSGSGGHPGGKLDLLVTVDFRMSTTCLHSDIVLPAASWYEKDDLNTTDLHPFIHPLSKAVEPVWESRSDWEIFRGLARSFSALCPGHLGKEKDIVLLPLQHDSPNELGQATEVRDWYLGECEPIPGKTMPTLKVVERDYPATYDKFRTLGPLVESQGIAGKGLNWKLDSEVEDLAGLNGTATSGPGKGRPLLETHRQAAEAILAMAPETNGKVALKAWAALEEKTGRRHRHLAEQRGEERIVFDDLLAQPRRTINSPVWSGIESHDRTYTGFYTNVHELIPWRTLTGRQQLYQDHAWMRAFGEALATFKPPVDTRTIAPLSEPPSAGELRLNFITAHQKWGIHSTYTDNLLMLTLSRGGPIVWLNEEQAATVEIADNDWIELFNSNGGLTARAVVSQRIPAGMCIMYHAQEKVTNTPASKVTGRRGIHNSVTRVTVKPTHMIGGYAQLSYFINYYGTVGSNRDEYVRVRKLSELDWLEGPREHAEAGKESEWQGDKA